MKLRRLFGLAILAVVTATSHAQSMREETWEMGVSVVDLSGVDVQGTNGSSLSVRDDVGFGFTGAYNATERLAVGVDLNFSKPGYTATLVPDNGDPAETVRANLDIDVIHFKGIFNLLENDITPFVEVGVGWTYLDSNIVSGISGPICWWDPWWGYVCSNYYSTYSDTRTSYSYAAGIRWDIEDTWVFRASWGVHEIDTSRSSEDIELDNIQVSFGWRF